MADTSSFDICSKVDDQEVSNAVNQAAKELNQRYDLKDSGSSIEFKSAEHKLVLNSSDEYKLKSVAEVLKSKLIKRNISVKALQFEDPQDASGGTVRQEVAIQQGIPKDKAKQMVSDIKASKVKVQAQIMDDQVRVSGKKRDDLQQIIQLIKDKDYGIFVDFGNYR